jgi:hypothetical protein
VVKKTAKRILPVKPKQFELSPVHSHKRKERPKLNFGELDQAGWNRKIENDARGSFQETEELRQQVNTIENLGKIKESAKANIEGQVKNLSNKPFQRWTPQETEAFKELSPALQKHILKENEKRTGR